MRRSSCWVGVLVEDPNNVTAHTLAGQIFMHQGRLVEADDMFRKASDDGAGSDADASLVLFLGQDSRVARACTNSR